MRGRDLYLIENRFRTVKRSENDWFC